MQYLIHRQLNSIIHLYDYPYMLAYPALDRSYDLFDYYIVYLAIPYSS